MIRYIDRFLHHLDAPLASEDQLELVHSPDHIAFVKEQAPQSGYAMLDGDTIMNPHTWQASLRAAGAAIAGVDAVIKGEVENVFCADKKIKDIRNKGRKIIST